MTVEMECKREKSSMTVIILQVILIVLYAVGFVFAIIAIGLFGKAQDDLKKALGNKDYCSLFFKDFNENRSSNCNYVFAGEVLTAIGLAVLLILSIVKTVFGFMKLVEKYRTKLLC